jgi:hypothetical protein
MYDEFIIYKIGPDGSVPILIVVAAGKVQALQRAGPEVKLNSTESIMAKPACSVDHQEYEAAYVNGGLLVPVMGKENTLPVLVVDQHKHDILVHK